VSYACPPPGKNLGGGREGFPYCTAQSTPAGQGAGRTERLSRTLRTAQDKVPSCMGRCVERVHGITIVGFLGFSGQKLVQTIARTSRHR
jgi:hypothetical protein